MQDMVDGDNNRTPVNFSVPDNLTNDVANAIGPLAVIPINYGYGALATRIHHIPDPSPGKSFEDQVFLFFFVPFVLLNKKRFPAVIGFSRIVH